MTACYVRSPVSDLSSSYTWSLFVEGFIIFQLSNLRFRSLNKVEFNQLFQVNGNSLTERRTEQRHS